MNDFLSIYENLPYPLKVIAASIIGYQLRWWRYSDKTEQLVSETLVKNNWSKTQWVKWQEERLEYLLNIAAVKIPYYQSIWQQIHKKNNRISWNYLENWPILEKEIVRTNPKAFIPTGNINKKMYVDHSSGTTGKPTLIYESHDTVIKWYALLEARLRRIFQVSYKDRWGIFGGQKIIPLSQTAPPYWVMNYGLNQIYFSIFHIRKETTKYYLDALYKYSPTHLIVYPSIFAILAANILDSGLVPPKLKVIICNAEKLIDKHRALITQAFQCPVINSYGLAELTSAGSECHQGKMHYWPDVGLVEVFDQRSSTFVKETGIIGDYVSTGLLNEDMVFIRYRYGDRGSLPEWDQECNCGVKLPFFGTIQGRQKDLIQTTDGRSIYILDSMFNHLPIIEGQLIQENLTSFSFNIVPINNGINRDDLKNKLHTILFPYLGNVHISIKIVDSIPRDDTGKWQPIISRINHLN